MRPNVIWLSTITLRDVDRLEEVFAYLTDVGWIVPKWLAEMRKMIEERDRNVL